MVILFDFISLQGYHNGGEEYTRIILNSILRKKEHEIIGLYDSKLKFLDDDYDKYSKQINFIDIQKYKISSVIHLYHVELFYIGIGQRFYFYDLTGITCRTICTLHDIGNIEIAENNIMAIMGLTWKHAIVNAINLFFPKCRFSTRNRLLKAYANLRKFLREENVEVVTVSEASMNAIYYFFPELKSKNIKVFYPPLKNHMMKEKPDGQLVKEIINRRQRYLLMLDANRINKNFKTVKQCLPMINKYFPDIQILLTGLPIDTTLGSQVQALGYVSNNDIEHLYKNAWATLYPSLAEGFGYPIVESMKFGVPVLCSNVTSIPEVAGDAGVYFSPYYANDLFGKIRSLEQNYDFYVQKAMMQYKKISKRQEIDLELLINYILNN